MKAIDIDQELRELVATEEVLGYFDFVLPLDEGGTRREIEGLCKVSRPRERNSRSTYLSIFFIVDAPDEATRQAVDAHMKRADWTACGDALAGVDCVLAIPHRGAGAGLFLKEVDVYLDGTQPPNAAFVREALQPAIARTAGLRPGELTVWDETESAAARPAPAPSESLLDRLRRFAGR
jgi:hypothetical protein